MNILVVDDNTEARKLLVEFLTQAGFYVVEAENGKEALEILKAKKDFALIISDILMPVMDGFKFCHFEIDSKIGKGTNFKVIIPKKNVGC